MEAAGGTLKALLLCGFTSWLSGRRSENSGGYREYNALFTRSLFSGDPPASTWIGRLALGQFRFLIEIEADSSVGLTLCTEDLREPASRRLILLCRAGCTFRIVDCQKLRNGRLSEIGAVDDLPITITCPAGAQSAIGLPANSSQRTGSALERRDDTSPDSDSSYRQEHGARVSSERVREEKSRRPGCLFGYPLCAMGDRTKVATVCARDSVICLCPAHARRVVSADLLEPRSRRDDSENCLHVVEGGTILACAERQLKDKQNTGKNRSTDPQGSPVLVDPFPMSLTRSRCAEIGRSRAERKPSQVFHSPGPVDRHSRYRTMAVDANVLRWLLGG